MYPLNDVEVVDIIYQGIETKVQKVTRRGKIYLYAMDNKPIDFGGAMGEELVR